MGRKILNITSGDVCGNSLRESGIDGEVFVWHDILYDGPRTRPGWPDEGTLDGRARFIEEVTGGGLGADTVLQVLRAQYQKLEEAAEHDDIVLWFDACLFDLSMLCHIVTCAAEKGIDRLQLVYVDSYPGVLPFHGLGQLSPEQLGSLRGQARPVTADQVSLAREVDAALALQDTAALGALAARRAAPIPGIPAAARRWLEEWPDRETGLGKLERLALEAVQAGRGSPREIFAYVAAHDTPPQFWGDIQLWGKINGLCRRIPPLLRIDGPTQVLPQWEGQGELDRYLVCPVEEA